MDPEIYHNLKKENRSEEEAIALSTYFTNLTFFTKLLDSFGDAPKEMIIMNIWKEIRHEYIKAETVIFREGDKSNGKMYVIITGQVAVGIKKKINVFDKQKEEEEKEKQDKLNDETKKKLKRKQSKIMDQPPVNNDPHNIGDIVARLGNGFAFGEKAIQEEGGIRMASILTLTDCDALVIMRKDFLKIKDTLEQAKLKKINIMKQFVPKIDNLNQKILEQLAYLFEDRGLIKGDHLTDEGSEGQNIFVLLEGKLEMQRSIEVQMRADKSKGKSMGFGKGGGSGGGGVGGGVATAGVTGGFGQSGGSSSSGQSSGGGLQIKKKFQMKVAEFETQESFGEELLHDFKVKSMPYAYTIIVLSRSAKVMQINKRVFYQKFPKDSVQQVYERYLVKEKHRQEMIQEFQIKIQNNFSQEEFRFRNDGLKQQLASKQRQTYYKELFSQSLLPQTQCSVTVDKTYIERAKEYRERKNCEFQYKQYPTPSPQQQQVGTQGSYGGGGGGLNRSQNSQNNVNNSSYNLTQQHENSNYQGQSAELQAQEAKKRNSLYYQKKNQLLSQQMAGSNSDGNQAQGKINVIQELAIEKKAGSSMELGHLSPICPERLTSQQQRQAEYNFNTEPSEDRQEADYIIDNKYFIKGGQQQLGKKQMSVQELQKTYQTATTTSENQQKAVLTEQQNCKIPQFIKIQESNEEKQRQIKKKNTCYSEVSTPSHSLPIQKIKTITMPKISGYSNGQQHVGVIQGQKGLSPQNGINDSSNFGGGFGKALGTVGTGGNINGNNFQFVLEQTWDFGTENLKKKDQNIKNELIQRNILKPDPSEENHVKIFPTLEKYKKRIQKTKSEKFQLEQQRHYTTISKLIKNNSLGFQQQLIQLHKPSKLSLQTEAGYSNEHMEQQLPQKKNDAFILQNPNSPSALIFSEPTIKQKQFFKTPVDYVQIELASQQQYHPTPNNQDNCDATEKKVYNTEGCIMMKRMIVQRPNLLSNLLSKKSLKI